MTAYSIVRIDVKDADEYAKYAEIATQALKEFGGEFLARGGEYHHLEGTSRARNVSIKWPDVETAKKFYYSDLYQEALGFGIPAATRDYVIVEGV
jgi:uncharacterized protein (DUF1330 family)